MSRPSSTTVELLRQRSELLDRMREFFRTRGFVEVETPLLAPEVIPELHIEPIPVSTTSGDVQYLQASPELHMKRLAAEGMAAIFQMTRSFRAGEQGDLHNPEFTLVEWYRVGDTMHDGMLLLDELCQRLLGTLRAERLTYTSAFEKELGISPLTASPSELADCARGYGVAVSESFPTEDRDEWLNLLLTSRIEPQLGHARPVLLYDYPASQAALAKTALRDGRIEVAERFELYYQGIELANGYHELTDANQLRLRFEQVNAQRVADNRPALPLPESLLATMEKGLPDCTGCALGFDRLVMLALGKKTIHEVRF